MVYSSMLFVFFFLALNLLSQILLKTPKAKNIALLVFSLIFYGWSGLGHLVLLLVTVVIAWFFGLLIQVVQEEKKKKSYLVVSLVLILGLVAIFGYRGFLFGITKKIFDVPEVIPQIVMPVGVAYYTLQLVSYLVDVYRGEVKAQRKFWVLLTYASLFHLAMGGPVVRYSEIRKDLLRRRTRLSDVSSGISRFTIGLAKKTILAESLSAFADSLLVGNVSMQSALSFWVGILAYGLSVYLSLAAYADMAIGMGLICGLHYPEHFDRPFTACSISDFWSRWQMTMVFFFADYVHDPLGDPDEKPWKDILMMAGVWLLIGLWLGAGWNTILWALFFLVLVALEEFVLGNVLEKIPGVLSRFLTLVLVCVSFVLLRCEDLSLLPTILGGMIGLGGGLASKTSLMIVVNNLPILALGIAAATPLGTKLRSLMSKKAEDGGVMMVIDSLWEALHPVILLILSAMAMTGLTTNPFLFFQF